jgi:hypothetical protein
MDVNALQVILMSVLLLPNTLCSVKIVLLLLVLVTIFSSILLLFPVSLMVTLLCDYTIAFVVSQVLYLSIPAGSASGVLFQNGIDAQTGVSLLFHLKSYTLLCISILYICISLLDLDAIMVYNMAIPGCIPAPHWSVVNWILHLNAFMVNAFMVNLNTYMVYVNAYMNAFMVNLNAYMVYIMPMIAYMTTFMVNLNAYTVYIMPMIAYMTTFMVNLNAYTVYIMPMIAYMTAFMVNLNAYMVYIMMNTHMTAFMVNWDAYIVYTMAVAGYMLTPHHWNAVICHIGALIITFAFNFFAHHHWNVVICHKVSTAISVLPQHHQSIIMYHIRILIVAIPFCILTLHNCCIVMCGIDVQVLIISLVFHQMLSSCLLQCKVPAPAITGGHRTCIIKYYKDISAFINGSASHKCLDIKRKEFSFIDYVDMSKNSQYYADCYLQVKLPMHELVQFVPVARARQLAIMHGLEAGLRTSVAQLKLLFKDHMACNICHSHITILSVKDKDKQLLQQQTQQRVAKYCAKKNNLDFDTCDLASVSHPVTNPLPRTHASRMSDVSSLVTPHVDKDTLYPTSCRTHVL